MTEYDYSAVVPAVNGCNLRCRGCIIAQNREAAVSRLSHDNYTRFFSTVLGRGDANAFNLQGYEPLLPDAWPLSKRLLEIALSNGVQASCVTNGTYLRERGLELMERTHGIFVSIDSHNAATHDRSRGMNGAWSQTVSGIDYIRAQFGSGQVGAAAFAEYLGVASILYPKGENGLIGMSAMLADRGVRNWLITPLVSVRRGGFADQDYEGLEETLISLSEVADSHGVRLVLSDELGQLKDSDLYQSLTVNTTEYPHLVTRLSPDGRYSIGREILSPAPTRHWDPNDDPLEFTRRVHAEYEAKMMKT